MSEPLRVRVIEVRAETADANSIAMEPLDHPEHFEYRPGQFLTFRIPTDRPEGAARCYSLCSAPGRREPMRVAVKRTVGGYGSNWLCDNVQIGDELEVLRPAGTFTPRSYASDFLLVAGGSGITPLLAILKTALDTGTGQVTLVYANRDEKSVIFADELRREVARYAGRLTVIHWLESIQGLPGRSAWQSLLRPYVGRPAFICGPEVFLNLVVDTLAVLGTPPDKVHVERFTSLASDPFESAAKLDANVATSTVVVTLDGETRTLAWPKSNYLLDVLRDAGLDAPFSCREGSCSACACFVLEGEVKLVRNEVLDDADLAERLTLACQAIPLTEVVKVTYDA